MDMGVHVYAFTFVFMSNLLLNLLFGLLLASVHDLSYYLTDWAAELGIWDQI